MEPIPIREVLTLIDRATGYGIDSYSREQLAELNENADGKHLLDRRTAYRLVDFYIEDRYEQLYGRPPRTEFQRERIVRSDGFQENAKYDRRDILNMLEYKPVQQKLLRHFYQNTTQIGGVYVPTVVAKDHPYRTKLEERKAFWI